MHTHHVPKEKGWRGSWFVCNVLAELPIIGPFFLTSKLSDAAYLSGQHTAMLLGGTASMMYGPIQSSMDDTMGIGYAKMTANMAIGMSAATITYNCAVGLGSQFYKTCSNSAKGGGQASYWRN